MGIWYVFLCSREKILRMRRNSKLSLEMDYLGNTTKRDEIIKLNYIKTDTAFSVDFLVC